MAAPLLEEDSLGCLTEDPFPVRRRQKIELVANKRSTILVGFVKDLEWGESEGLSIVGVFYSHLLPVAPVLPTKLKLIPNRMVCFESGHCQDE